MTYNGFRSDVLTIKSRLYEATAEETDVLRAVYERFRGGLFTASDFDDVCTAKGFCVRRARYIGYMVKVGSRTGKPAKQMWRLSQELLYRFYEETIIQFEPYRRDTHQNTRYQVNRRYLVQLGMTLDREWCYCRVTKGSQFDYVMCRVSHLKRRSPLCPVYKVDFKKCEEWLDRNIDALVSGAFFRV